MSATLKLKACHKELLRVVDEEIFTGPERWYKGWFAADADGRRVSYNGPEAVCFCFWGAVWKVATQLDMLQPGGCMEGGNVGLFSKIVGDGCLLNPGDNDRDALTFEEFKTRIANARALPVEEEVANG